MHNSKNKIGQPKWLGLGLGLRLMVHGWKSIMTCVNIRIGLQFDNCLDCLKFQT